MPRGQFLSAPLCTNCNSPRPVQGLKMRSDIVASQQRMQARLYEAKAAAKERDASRARECLDHAETEVMNLEKFLGR